VRGLKGGHRVLGIITAGAAMGKDARPRFAKELDRSQ
jgi:hypothetical protein